MVNQQDSPNARLLSSEGYRAQFAGRGRLRGALGLSLSAHAAAFLLAVFALSRVTGPGDATPAPAPLPQGIVWIAEAGPGRGGGGGGNQDQEPPQVAQAPGADRLTVPVAAAPRPDAETPHASRPIPLDIPSVATSAGLENLPGVLDTIPLTSVSLGPGSGTGAGDGNRGGIGGGDGDGLGDGRERGTGGDVYQAGDGVSIPRLIHETKPNYTGEALQAKVQGAVLLEGVVTPDGLLSAVQVIRSLDRQFGLDQEAIRTVSEWRFAPGRTRDGTAVPVRVAIEMAFTLR